jgi:HlyD family secretion protein
MKLKRLLKFIVPITVIILVLMMCVLLLCHGKSRPAEGVFGYKEFKVERGSMEIQVTANGTVEPIDRIQLKSKASGEIVQMNVEQGDYVQKGRLIARLDQKDEKAAVAQAQADLDIAKADLEQSQKAYERSEQLYKQNLISEEEKDQIELNYATAKGRLVRAVTTLDRAKERFDESVVYAPIPGIILQKYVEEGQIIASGVSTVGGGSPIADIADMAAVYVKAGVDEIDIGKIRVGQEASVTADAYPNLRFLGKIVRISPEARIDQNVTLFDVIVQVENREGKLKSGMNAEIEISVLVKKDLLLASATAVKSETNGGHQPGESTVFVKQGTRFVPRQVKTGLSNFRQVEIVSGLKEGDVIGVPITSRVQQESDQFEQRIKGERSFGRQNTQTQQPAAGGR